MVPPRPKSAAATAKTVLSTMGSIAATAVVARTVIQDFLPPEFRDYMYTQIRNIYHRFTNELTLVIHEYDRIQANELYEAARVYLGPKSSPTTRRLSVVKPPKEKSINLAVEQDEEVTDEYDGRKFTWVLVSRQSESRRLHHSGHVSSVYKEVRSFELTFNKKDKDFVMDDYLPYIIAKSKEMKLEKKTLKIFTVDYDMIYDLSSVWISMNLEHPATFDTLAMDSGEKETIMRDLERFVERREHYRRVGKAWKRGYLLYGPPGTGKSSLIAAMANYLNYDIYDLELTELESNSDLRRVLLATANKSILVVEDIDCTIEIEDRSSDDKESTSKSKKSDEKENKVTLSGLLNFVDGLWSSCGDERIMVFTTNHKEKLDPALLRPGRMDVHIHLSYCTPCGFRLLSENYLGIKTHSLFGEIEGLIESTQVTPAEVAGQLLKNDETDEVLGGLVEFLHEKKKKQSEEAKKEEKAV